MIVESLEEILKENGWEKLKEEGNVIYFGKDEDVVSIVNGNGIGILYNKNNGNIAVEAKIEKNTLKLSTQNYKKYMKEVVEILKYITKAMG